MNARGSLNSALARILAIRIWSSDTEISIHARAHKNNKSTQTFCWTTNASLYTQNHTPDDTAAITPGRTIPSQCAQVEPSGRNASH